MERKGLALRSGRSFVVAAQQIMLFGHNSDVKLGETLYHVQTEDRGVATALIDTTVYCRGRVLHRRTNNYLDLLPLDAGRHEESLRKRIDEQHRVVIDELRNGTLHLPPPPSAREDLASPKPLPGAPLKGDSANLASVPALALELINAKTWLAGKRANLQIAVRQTQDGGAVCGAKVVAHIDGSASPTRFTSETGSDGQARLEFEMPQLAAAEPALIIEATHASAKGHLKFQLRARPRVPTA